MRSVDENVHVVRIDVVDVSRVAEIAERLGGSTANRLHAVLCRSRKRVVRSARPEERDAEGKPKVGESDWRTAMDRVQGRTRSSEDKLNAALDRERNKQSRLDELFRGAKEKLGENEPEP